MNTTRWLRWCTLLITSAAALLFLAGGQHANATPGFQGDIPIAWNKAAPPEFRACVVGSAANPPDNQASFDEASRDFGARYMGGLQDTDGGNGPGGLPEHPGYQNNVQVLANQTANAGDEPTWQNIVSCVRAKIAASNKDDVFVLYWTSHGNRSVSDRPFCNNAADDDGDGENFVNDGCPAADAAEAGADCGNDIDDDADTLVNDGCPANGEPEKGPKTAEPNAVCEEFPGQAADDDEDGKVNDGCPEVADASEMGAQCNNDQDDDGDIRANDGCPAVNAAEPDAICGSDSIDDDADSLVNDGCPASGAAEAGAQCEDRLDSDGDNEINDGCPTAYDPSDEPALEEENVEPVMNALTLGATPGVEGTIQVWPPQQAPAQAGGVSQYGPSLIRDDAIAAELKRELSAAGKTDVGVVVIVDTCFPGEQADGTSDLGALLREPRTLIVAAERQYLCWSKDAAPNDAFAPGGLLKSPVFTQYLLKGLDQVPRNGCANNVSTRADVVSTGNGTASNSPNNDNFAPFGGDDDCVTTASELFFYAAQRTALEVADEDGDGLADEGGGDPFENSDNDNWPAAVGAAESDQCMNAADDDNPLDMTVNDGCRAVGLVAENMCGDALDNEPGGDLPDNVVNDGCPAVGAAEVNQCMNLFNVPNIDNIDHDGDMTLNDGCPSRHAEDPPEFQFDAQVNTDLDGLTNEDGLSFGADAQCTTHQDKCRQYPQILFGAGYTRKDSDGDGCPDNKEPLFNPAQGGARNPKNPYDYFNPTHDGVNRIDDILAVVAQYFKDDNDGSPGQPPYVAGYTPDTDRTDDPGSSEPWDLLGPNGQQRIDDILAIVKQYFHDCS